MTALPRHMRPRGGWHSLHRGRWPERAELSRSILGNVNVRSLIDTPVGWCRKDARSVSSGSTSRTRSERIRTTAVPSPDLRYAAERLARTAFPKLTITAPEQGIRFERDIAVAMHDGAKLRVNVFRPEREGRFPV